jgi:sugar phosphate isomerase/epimerase
MSLNFSINQWMTPHNSIWDDIEQYAAAGAQGIGLWEPKLTDPAEDERVAERIHEAGLQATYCSSTVWPILPGPLDTPGTPTDVPARVDAICRSVERFAAFEPLGIIVGGGRSGDPLHPAGPVEDVVSGLGVIADVAAEHNMRVAFELLGARRGAPLHTFGDLVAVLDSVGRPNVGILFDVIHSWCEPGLHDDIRRYIDRIDFVQLNDVRVPERSWCDRLLPGDGLDQATPITATLLSAGYDGWWELEVFSDDGTFGNAFPDSLWAVPHPELLRRGLDAARQVYERALGLVAQGAAG